MNIIFILSSVNRVFMHENNFNFNSLYGYFMGRRGLSAFKKRMYRQSYHFLLCLPPSKLSSHLSISLLPCNHVFAHQTPHPGALSISHFSLHHFSNRYSQGRYLINISKRIHFFFCIEQFISHHHMFKCHTANLLKRMYLNIFQLCYYDLIRRRNSCLWPCFGENWRVV